MNYITDRCLLLLFSFLSLLHADMESLFVIAFFTAVTFSGFCYALMDTNRGRRFPLLLLPLVYSCLAFLFPQFCFFLPLVCYDIPLSWSPVKPHSQREFFTVNRRPCVLSLSSLLFSFLGLTLSFWGQNVFFFLFLGIITALLLRYRTDTCERLRQKYRQARDDGTEIQLLLEEKNQSLLEKQDTEIYTATLRERNRIAREIHDNVGHMLTRSILMVGALKAVNQTEALKEPLRQLGDTLSDAMNSIRQSVHDLHDSSVNLQDSLQSLVRDFTFCPVTLTYDMSPELPREVKYSFISIAKEALVNISRHSNATRASITAVEHPGFYQFVIEDNGTNTGEIGSTGIGLTNMRSRVRTLNGNLQISQNQGFRIYITVPKEADVRSTDGLRSVGGGAVNSNDQKGVFP